MISLPCKRNAYAKPGMVTTALFLPFPTELSGKIAHATLSLREIPQPSGI